MKRRRALLFTSDTEFESAVRQALLGTDTIFLIARTVSDALQIACQRGRELDLAIMTFGEDCHGMTLLSAIHGCYEQLPTLVVVEKDSGHASALAYANGACICLSKPVSLVELTNAVAALQPTARQPPPPPVRYSKSSSTTPTRLPMVGRWTRSKSTKLLKAQTSVRSPKK